MEKDFYYTELFELYKNLLTDKQKELFESHYIFDLSFAEISQPQGISRQSVSVGLKKVREKLDEYELALGLYQKQTAIKQAVSTLEEGLKDKILEIIGR